MDVPPNLKKFASQLGTAADFVAYVSSIETRIGSNKARDVMKNPGISNFPSETPSRYLLLKTGAARIIDFRHFFAAASQSYSGQVTAAALGIRAGLTGPGSAVLLGLGNEILQCIDETRVSISDTISARSFRSRFNSCFSSEDLGSNRLGAQFGQKLIIAESEARSTSVSLMLRDFLRRLRPASAEEINKIKSPTKGEVAMEALMAILSGLHDAVFPSAY